MLQVSLSLSVIILNVNKFNSTITRQRSAGWILKNMIQLYAAYEKLNLDLETQMGWKW